MEGRAVLDEGDRFDVVTMLERIYHRIEETHKGSQACLLAHIIASGDGNF